MEKSLYTHQSENTTKTWLLMGLFLVIIVALGYFFSYYYQDQSILFFAIIFSIVMNIGSYWFSDKIVLRLAGAHKASKEAYYDLYTVTENLSITAGLPMPKLYVIDEPVPNAFATGRDKNHAAVAVTTGLLAVLDRSELEGVIAHELSHIGNKDILLQTIVVVLVGFVTLLADFFMRSHLFGGGRRNREGGGQLQAILMIVGVVLTILSPIIATLIQLAISRRREFLADASAALLTRYPDGLASALRKISAHSATMKRANHATAHLYIANPFAKKKSGIHPLQKMFMTHPPVEERIQALLGHRANGDVA